MRQLMYCVLACVLCGAALLAGCGSGVPEPKMVDELLISIDVGNFHCGAPDG